MTCPRSLNSRRGTASCSSPHWAWPTLDRCAPHSNGALLTFYPKVSLIGDQSLGFPLRKQKTLPALNIIPRGHRGWPGHLVASPIRAQALLAGERRWAGLGFPLSWRPSSIARRAWVQTPFAPCNPGQVTLPLQASVTPCPPLPPGLRGVSGVTAHSVIVAAPALPLAPFRLRGSEDIEPPSKWCPHSL